MVLPSKYERLNKNGEDKHDTNTARYRRDSIEDDSEEIELQLKSRSPKHYHENGLDNSRVGSNQSNFAHINKSNENGATLLHGEHVTQTASTRLMQLAIGTLATVLLYLTLSITLTFYQKSLIKELKYPLSIVTYHMALKLILAIWVRAIYKCRGSKGHVQLDCRVAIRKMAPTGIASGLDIGFSNWGLELVPISLYTMTKSSTIIFILFFAILLGLEKKSWLLVFIVALIATGLFMFTYKSTQFDTLGFMFILVASLSSGVRWSFAQFIMQKSKLGLHNPIDMIYHMQPWMIASLLPFLVGFEGPNLYNVALNFHNTSNETMLLILLKVTIGAVLAFLMEVSEFLVLSKTSSLTLSIAGIFKDICQLALAVELNGDQLTLINVLGLGVCLAGILCHLLHKYAVLTKNDDGCDIHFIENFAENFNATQTKHTVQQQQQTHSTLTIPLLDQSDSEDNSDNIANNTDVIFDVLKRRGDL